MITGNVDSLISSAYNVKYKNNWTKGTACETIAILDSYEIFRYSLMKKK